ncbi:MAG TPA: HAD family phosphatase [Rubrobacteraceae bacterium]|nr:HAD family phosphatase [Rubrobacteraceae bacterium]
MTARGGVETVVFDLGGVLIDWNPRYLYRKIFANEEEMEDFLTTVATMEWHLEQDRGRTTEEATALLLSRHPNYGREIEAYYGRWDEMFDAPLEGTVGVLRELRASGLPLYALTNWSAEVFPLARKQYEFLGWFDDIIVSGEERIIKPDRGIYDVLVQRTGLDPARTVFIDDSRPNVLAAEQLGFTGIEFRDASRLREELARLEVLPVTSERGVTDG